jgi:hypothetical protein
MAAADEEWRVACGTFFGVVGSYLADKGGVVESLLGKRLRRCIARTAGRYGVRCWR